MVSRDLTCNETMPPLEDGDPVHLNMRRARNFYPPPQHNSAAATIIVAPNNGQAVGGVAVPMPTNHRSQQQHPMFVVNSTTNAHHPNNDSQHTLMNHTTTVRDVVTRHIRNSKLNADTHLVGYPKLGGILSSIGGPIVVRQKEALITSNVQHNRHTFNNQNSNGCMTTVHHHPHAAAMVVNRSEEVVAPSSFVVDHQRRYALLSRSPSCSSPGSIPPPTPATIIAKSSSLINNNNHHHLHYNNNNNLLGSAGSSLSPQFQQVHSNNNIPTTPVSSPSLHSSATIIDGRTTFVVAAASVSEHFHPHQNHLVASETNSISSATQWAQHPPIEHHLISSTNLSPNQKLGVIRSATSPNKGLISAATKPNDFAVQPQMIWQQPSGNGSGSPLSVQPQAHTSPRPSILRGNASIRRLTDRDRPASVSGNYTNPDTFGNGLNSRLVNCASRGGGEDPFAFGGDESPRKQPRKQKFEPGQSVQDKLRMEVVQDQRFEQTASVGPSLPGCKSPIGSLPTAQPLIAQNAVILHQADPSTSVGAVLSGKCGGIVGGGGALLPKAKNEPKKRGRPKMNCRTQPLPFAASVDGEGGVIGGSAGEGLIIGDLRRNPQQAMISNSHLQQQHPNPIQQNTATSISSARPVMVDVDAILHGGMGLKKRTYRKRTPEVDPLTGEFVKKVRKKGSGRKSKKEMAIKMEMHNSLVIQQQQQQSLSDFTLGGLAVISTTFASNSQIRQNSFSPILTTAGGNCSTAPTVSSSQNWASIETAEERNVIRALCRFKTDRNNSEALKKLSAQEYSSDKSSNTNKPVSASKSANKKRQNLFEFDEAAIEQPSSSSSSLSTSKVQSLPLFSDLNELNALRPLLRRCERGLNSTDNCHLSESYEELINFLESHPRSAFDCQNSDFFKNSGQRSEEFELRSGSKGLDKQAVSKMSAQVGCLIFDSHEELKCSLGSLRLFPSACAYFDASQRLLASLRTSLLGSELYQSIQQRIRSSPNQKLKNSEEKSLTPNLVLLSNLEPKLEREEEDRETNELVRRLADAFVEEQLKGGGGADQRQQNKQSLEQKFLFQLDVAQSMDTLLEQVERNKQNRHRFDCQDGHTSPNSSSYVPSTPNSATSSKSSANVQHFLTSLSDENMRLFGKRNNLGRRDEERKRRNGCEWKGKSGRRARRKRRRWEGKEEEESEEEEWEEAEIKKKRKEEGGEDGSSEGKREPEKSEIIWDCIERCLEDARAETALLDSAFEMVIKLEKEMTKSAQRFGEDNPSASSNNASTDQILQLHHPHLHPIPTSSSSSSMLERQESSSDLMAAMKRRRNPHKSRQFAFRPSSQLLNELFKSISSMTQQEEVVEEKEEDQKGIDAEERQNPPAEMGQQTVKGSEGQNHQRNGNNNNAIGTMNCSKSESGNEQHQQLLLRIDVEKMATNSAHISATAFAQLRHKYPELLPGGQASEETRPASSNGFSLDAKKSNKQHDAEGCRPRPNDLFKPTLNLHFPPASTPFERTEFLKARLRELREICATTVGLARSRMLIAGQCVDSVRELLEEMGNDKNGPTKTAMISKSKSGRKHCLEEEAEEEEGGCGTAVVEEAEENSGGGGGRQKPKRAAHQRALCQLISSSVAGSVTSSRTASRDQSVAKEDHQQIAG